GAASDSEDWNVRPVSAREFAGDRAVVQGTAHRRDEFFPRPGGVGTVAGGGVALVACEPGGGPRAAGVGAGLLDGRGSLLAGHLVPGGAGTGQAARKLFAADLRHRSRPRRGGQG